jgi:putative hydrolase of the HAD superfamily
VTLQAVTFDFWQTIAREPQGGLLHPRRVTLWHDILEGAHERDRIDEVLRGIAHHRERLWREGELFGAAEAAAVAAAELDPDIDDATERALVDAFVGSGEGIELELTVGIEEALRELDEAGLRLGIVCDVGFTSGAQLRDVLDRAGILGRFDGWAFSDEVGAYKPDPAIFRHALREIGGIAPDRAAHIGDLRRTDVAGARAMGMVAIRYRGANDDPPADGPEGHHVLDDHAELAALLRGAALLPDGAR